MTLLPPNATRLERALEAATSRVSEVQAPIETLLDPDAIDAPWLAWGLSADSWDADWSEAVKRQAVAESIALHRIKGTRLSVESVLTRFDQFATIVEWHEATPRRVPHTFEVTLPMAGGRQCTAAFAEAIVREVGRVKPLREHFTLLQSFTTTAAIGIQGVARPLLARRDDMTLVDDRSEDWEDFLQTENGEPLQAETANFLDTAS